jgi:hypothetical protein
MATAKKKKEERRKEPWNKYKRNKRDQKHYFFSLPVVSTKILHSHLVMEKESKEK